MAKSIQTLLPDLVSLGIAFGRERPKNPADIEPTLIRALPFLHDDLKVLNLILTWAWEMGDLVHIERLKALAKDLDVTDLAFLGGIAEFVSREHRSWKLISENVLKRLPPNFSYALPEKITLAVDIGHTPAEIAFLPFGLRIPQVVLADRKKLIPRNYLVEDNPRFQFRAVFGTNWRADIAYLLWSERRPLSATEISKTLSCSYETAHRIKKGLEESRFESILSFNSKPHSSEKSR